MRRADYVRTWCRLALRALLLAGRFPWLAFLIFRPGFAMIPHAPWKKFLAAKSVAATG
jgi:hypothetical protein